VGKVAEKMVGPVPAPTPTELATEKASLGLPLIDTVGLPARISGGGNLRLWPTASAETAMRTLGHNAPLWALNAVEGEGGEMWYQVNTLDPATQEPVSMGYLHNSVVRVPEPQYLPSIKSGDRADGLGRWFEADLKEPAILTAFENGAPLWSTLTLHGTAYNPTPKGWHEILWRVANETMTSERVYPPIPRNAPGGYYLTGVLFTQYFSADGASIHYNYWSSNWGYAGSHGCLGVAYNEAKFAWDWAEVGTPVYVFA
jgi:hypothetical protein